VKTRIETAQLRRTRFHDLRNTLTPVLIQHGREPRAQIDSDHGRRIRDLMLRGNRSGRRAAPDSAQTAPAPM